MRALLLALAGLPVGIVLDRIVAALAVPFLDDEEDGPAPNTARARRRRASAETGSLMIEAAQPAKGWLRRLLIVAATAGLFASAGARYSEPQHLAIVAAYICVLIVCAATDVIAYRVPNIVTYPAIAGAILIAAAMPHTSLWSALAGGGLAGGIIFLPALLTGGAGMGIGDVKLATFAGLALGIEFVLPALLVTALSGGAVAAFLMIFRLRARGEPIPYAPFIAAGALAALLWQGTVFVSLS